MVLGALPAGIRQGSLRAPGPEFKPGDDPVCSRAVRAFQHNKLRSGMLSNQCTVIIDRGAAQRMLMMTELPGVEARGYIRGGNGRSGHGHDS